jgi:DNA-binding beta-propeller fold protein YncE
MLATVAVAVAAVLVAGVATAVVAAVPGVSGPRMIGVRDGADALAVTPDGRTLFVANGGDDTGAMQIIGHTVTPVVTATGRPGRPVPVGSFPDALAVTPDGRTLFAASQTGNTVTPVSLPAGRAGSPIRAGPNPQALVVTPDGRTLYVASRAGTVTPVDIATGKIGRPISVPEPSALAVTPDGRTLFAITRASTVTPIAIPAGQPGKPVTVGPFRPPWPSRRTAAPCTSRSITTRTSCPSTS